MQLGLSALLAFLDTCPSSTLTLATVIRTEGASYRKAGAMMLIDANMNTSGLVSGGCLEDDLADHARSVFATGEPTVITYDLSHEESASLWGLGLGCGGRIDVLLERIGRQNHYGGLSELREHYFGGNPCRFDKVVSAPDEAWVGRYQIVTDQTATDDPATVAPGDGATLTTQDGVSTLSVPVSPVNRLLVCGAGPDAIPLVRLAASLDWQVDVCDPRPAYLTPELFAAASRRLCLPPDEVELSSLGTFQAAVIMTHNVERDCTWLRKLYLTPVPYIGLLGPAARRDLLLERAGLTLEPRLHGPAGLDIGATLPEEIALSIVAQMHASLRQRSGTYLSSV